MQRKPKGDGSVYFDEKRNLYVGQVTTGYDPETGKRKRKTVYGKTKKEAKDKVRELSYQLYSGKYIDDSKITVKDLAMSILNDKLARNAVKHTSYCRNLETLKCFGDISNVPVQKLTEIQIRNCLNSQTSRSDSVIHKIYILLNQAMSEAEKRGVISKSPMPNILCPKSNKKKARIRALTIPEQKTLINILLTKDIPYSEQMLLALSTGMRMGEINALMVEDVNFIFNYIRVNKTIGRGLKGEAILNDTTKTEAGTRNIIMSDSTRKLLKEIIADREEGLIFERNGKMITTAQVNCQFRRTIEKYKITDETVTDGKITLHSLRHTYGTRCAESGMPPKVLQELMGHSDIRITMNTYFYATRDYITENVKRIQNQMKAAGLDIDTKFSDSQQLVNK